MITQHYIQYAHRFHHKCIRYCKRFLHSNAEICMDRIRVKSSVLYTQYIAFAKTNLRVVQCWSDLGEKMLNSWTLGRILTIFYPFLYFMAENWSLFVMRCMVGDGCMNSNDKWWYVRNVCVSLLWIMLLRSEMVSSQLHCAACNAQRINYYCNNCYSSHFLDPQKWYCNRRNA
jgi:hypothetical protein